MADQPRLRASQLPGIIRHPDGVLEYRYVFWLPVATELTDDQFDALEATFARVLDEHLTTDQRKVLHKGGRPELWIWD